MRWSTRTTITDAARLEQRQRVLPGGVVADAVHEGRQVRWHHIGLG
jgi:hypothetical protein